MTEDHAEDSRYQAVRGRDARFDGEFFFAVITTGIHCRPSCPATTPTSPSASAPAARDSAAWRSYATHHFWNHTGEGTAP